MFATSKQGLFGPRRRFLGALLGSGLLLASTALTLSVQAAPPADLAGEQTLRFAMDSEPARIAATGDLSSAAYTVFTLIHRGLVAYNASGELVNALAESIDTTDSLTYTVTLREGLTFSDGTPLTSANVKNSLLHWGKPDVASHAYTGMKDIASIDTPDERTAVITLVGVNASFIEYLADPAAAIVTDAAVEEGAVETPVAAQIGAGPFMIESWDKGLSMTFVKNPSYFGADDVYLDRIEGQLYIDGTARMNALSSGDVDFINGVPWEAFDTIASTPGLVMDAQSANFQYVMFNTTVEPYDNPLVRQAIAYAINRDNSVRAAFYGHGRPLYGPLNGDTDTNLWEYNPEKAKELLAEAGFADGLEANFLTIGGNFYQDMSLSIQADLQAVGINITLDAVDGATRNQRAFAGDYEFTINGTFSTVKDPLAYLGGLVSGPPSQGRSVGYNNPELNAVLEAGLRAGDPAEKEARLAEALEIIKTDVPLAFFNTRNAGYAYSERLKGFATLARIAPFSGYSFEHAYLSN